MSPYFFIAAAALCICSLAMPVALLCTKSIAALRPNIRDRDVHTVRKPRVGGLAMWFTVVLVLSGFSFFGKSIGLPEIPMSMFVGIMAGLLVLFVVGILDDIQGVSPLGQLVGQATAGFCLVLGGIGIDFFRLPWGGEIQLGWIAYHIPFFGTNEYFLGTTLFTIFWVMLIINVINWFDGLDGLAGSISLTGSLTIYFLSQRLGVGISAMIAAITAGTVAGFLPWNWYPSKLFMGTVGSQLLAFLLATAAIVSGGKVATAVLVLGIPLFDSIIVVIRRVSQGVSPFKADQRHLHHRLLHIGLSVPQVVLAITTVSGIFAILAYRAQRSSEKGWLTLGVVGLMLMVVWLTYYFEHKKVPPIAIG